MQALRSSGQDGKLIGVKYCGGCNPRYDRRAAYEKILADVLGSADEKGIEIRFESATEGVVYDALLVVNGCSSSCAEVGAYEVNSAPVYVRDGSGVTDALAELKNILFR